MKRILLLLLIQAFSLHSVEFHSLWLDSPRSSWPQLQSDLQCDIAIVGAGISGVATLYFLLTSTEKTVALFEKSLVASGATGHNAGLAVPSIEKPLSELIEEFGYEAAKQLFEEIDSGTDLLDEISAKVGFETELVPLATTYFGHSSLSTLIDWLQEGALRAQTGRQSWTCWALDDEERRGQIPAELHERLQWVSREEILKALKIDAPECIGITFGERKCARMNSAHFCDRVLQYLAQTFPDRCLIYENSEISHIDLGDDEQILHHGFGKVSAKDLILCTNAYTGFPLFDARTQKGVAKLAEAILPREGFMAAYPIEESSPSLSGFIPEEGTHVPYWYLSRAPLSQDKKGCVACLGGPEYTFSSPLSPEQIDQQAEESLQLMGKFMSGPPSFFWHGTMGYTQNGMRWVGEDPDRPHLWYNLGCNGIGILPALAGGKRIARQIGGEVVGPSLFDPPKDR